MARQPFGGSGSEMVYGPPAVAGDPLVGMVGVQFRIYEDAAAAVVASITDTEGTLIAGSVITADANSQLPAFMGPDTDTDDGAGSEVYRLWCRPVQGGAILPLYRNGGIPGEKGDKGDSPTDAQVANSLNTYFATNPPPKGDKGDPGTAGRDGAAFPAKWA